MTETLSFHIHCTNCRRPYPDQGAPFRCPTCGGLFDFVDQPLFDPDQVDPEQPGIWRYRHTFGLPAAAVPISLGEGNTPLVWREINGRQVAFKLEYKNPTSSYKDRGAATLLSFLASRQVTEIVEDSSGNAGSACAAYAAQARLPVKIYVPDYASPAKRKRIQSYGAQLVRILGPRSNAAEAVLRAVEEGAVYASHAYLPFGMPGYATAAYEIFEQIGEAPGALITPAGQGNLLLALGRGFLALQKSGLIKKLPVFVGVQALACAPLWAVHQYGATGLRLVTEGETLAEGVRIKHPIRGDALLQLIAAHNGKFIAVAEEQILTGRDQLANLGFNVEPTSAIVWSALTQIIGQVPDPIAVVLSGAGHLTI